MIVLIHVLSSAQLLLATVANLRFDLGDPFAVALDFALVGHFLLERHPLVFDLAVAQEPPGVGLVGIELKDALQVRFPLGREVMVAAPVRPFATGPGPCRDIAAGPSHTRPARVARAAPFATTAASSVTWPPLGKEMM